MMHTIIKPKQRHTPRSRAKGYAQNNPPAPLLPHERDEAATEQQTARPQPIIEQAYQDTEKGIVDTDRRSATGLSDDVPSRRKNRRTY